MALPQFVTDAAKPEFDVPFGKNLVIHIRQIDASEYRECAKKFMPKEKEQNSDRRYMGALCFGTIGITDCSDEENPIRTATKITEEEAVKLWQHAGRVEATGSCMEILYRWGLSELSKAEYVRMGAVLIAQAEARLAGKPEPEPEKQKDDDDPFGN